MAAGPRDKEPTGKGPTGKGPVGRGVLGRRDVVFGGLLAATGAVAYARTPRFPDVAIRDGELDKLIPLAIGPWRFRTESGLVLPPPDQLVDQLYSQQVARAYEPVDDASIAPVMLMVAYGSSQSGMLQVHRPEVCYPASGFALSPTLAVDIDVVAGRRVPANYFTATRDLRTERVLYWTRVGDALPRSWTEQRLAVMSSNLRRRIPDGVLVRLSTIGGDEATAKVTLDRFAATMLADLPPRGRRVLIGDGEA